MARYRVLIKPSAAKEIEEISTKKDRQRIVSRIRALARGARPPGCEKLAGYEDRYRVRQGRYRIVYAVDDREAVVRVVEVGQRKDIYR